MVQHFPSLQRLELDVSTFYVCDRDHVARFSWARLQPDLPEEYFALHLLRDLDLGIEQMSFSSTGDGQVADPDVVIRVYNEDVVGGWESRRRAGTLRPAVRVSAADYETLGAFVHELLFLPHELAIVRLRGSEPFHLS
ncbi:hypothetical protein B0A48_00722 [Cryoendolithus antarcticus]|uniref:Uncharacterized protein n=1 Tax=Cryoendolithus antarcticus TaxID=1507870 RepID=A0A1V8TVF9_9PEZI|nr:hypothetical protein B0A48_00722 [Cryoendolithus antarcticus]